MINLKTFIILYLKIYYVKIFFLEFKKNEWKQIQFLKDFFIFEKKGGKN